MKRIILGGMLVLSSTTVLHAEKVQDWDVEGLQKESKREGFTFKVRENWVTRFLRNGGDLQAITGAIKPADAEFLKNSNVVELNAEEDLPAHFDWRDEVPGGLSPIRNQRSCGSCWAFATVAVVEALMRIKNPETPVDLAEQTLVSRCSSAGSCSGGWFSAFNYIKNPGLPGEAQDPYKAYNTSCKQGLVPEGKIVRWNYITNNGGSPTTEQLKTAIKNYGPIAVTVYGGFSSYSSGVFNRCYSGGENHMVNLVGWDDESQSWIMRNSWGSSWGEKGYMRILFKNSRGSKCNNIGQTAAYAVLEEEN